MEREQKWILDDDKLGLLNSLRVITLLMGPVVVLEVKTEDSCICGYPLLDYRRYGTLHAHIPTVFSGKMVLPTRQVCVILITAIDRVTKLIFALLAYEGISFPAGRSL